jgi:hypothetical protein
MPKYELHDWHGEGRMDCVVTFQPEVLQPGQSSIWPDGKVVILIADCSETREPEGNARQIAEALNR